MTRINLTVDKDTEQDLKFLKERGVNLSELFRFAVKLKKLDKIEREKPEKPKEEEVITPNIQKVIERLNKPMGRNPKEEAHYQKLKARFEPGAKKPPEKPPENPSGSTIIESRMGGVKTFKPPRPRPPEIEEKTKTVAGKRQAVI